MKIIDWYFDFVSPFSYLQLERFPDLSNGVEARFRPVLLAGLLKHWDTKGPAETPPRRRFTYRHVLWLARHHGIDLRMPPAHPFNPLAALRLAIALESRPEAIREIFRFFWRDGHSSDNPVAWKALTDKLGVKDVEERLAFPAVKQELRDNTEQAIHHGVFGVPTFRVDKELFWGFDAGGMLLDYLHDPHQFDDPEMVRVSNLPEGVMRS
ncbi:MAG: 2-hydroxychromene-2-carboxylate isomerase [Gammaproteobacteria bacterium]|nr:2-hydroxychromene-2-carboxylate isomerase [Gammaproteobacteria bacterium]